MPMDRRWIKLTSISGKGIRSFAIFQKPSLYAVVSISGRPNHRSTPPDPTGGENPVWDSPVRLDLDDDSDAVLEIGIMSQWSILFGGDRLVGKVNVPVNELMEEGFDGSVCHVSYQVTCYGRPNGVISFSYKINPPRRMDVAVQSPPAGGYYPPQPQWGHHVALYPQQQQQGHVACYPPPVVDPACCYSPPPRDRYGYDHRPEWDRRLY